MKILAPAKLNLALNITGRRADGYHLLDSLFVFCGLADELTFDSAEDLTLSISGPHAGAIAGDPDNLVLRAAQLLQSTAGIRHGARISLVKHIPVAAGLGGGSADAAAALSALNRFWKCHLPGKKLHALAARLGADVPACLASRPVLATGIGDILTALPPLPDCGVLLINPRVATPTPAVFKAFAKANPVIRTRSLVSLERPFDDLDALVGALVLRGNDLLQAAIAVTPEISDMMAELSSVPNVVYASLSGSGASGFALLRTKAEATEAARRIAQLHPDWWSWSGRWRQ